jgi:mRNA interferase RelE/StbE
MAGLPAEVVGRIDAAILKIEADPHTRGARKLRGISGYRLRVGRYRLLYDVDAHAGLVTVYGIRHRREAYR